MKKYLILIAAALIVLPGLGLSDTFSLRAGYFFPKANSDLWTTEFDNLTLVKSDYQAAVFGVSFDHFFNPYVSLTVSVDTYSKIKSGFYRDYVGYSFPEGDFAYPASDFNGDFSLIQSFSVSFLPIQLSVKLTPLGRRGGFIPYIGGGVALNVWSVRVYGDLVDFSDTSWVDSLYPDVQIYPVYLADTRDDNRLALGYQGFAGVMIPVGTRMTVEGEFKYSYSKQDMKNFVGFQPFEMSGFQFSIGLNYWF
jgi:hypothetical protein